MKETISPYLEKLKEQYATAETDAQKMAVIRENNYSLVQGAVKYAENDFVRELLDFVSDYSYKTPGFLKAATLGIAGFFDDAQAGKKELPDVVSYEMVSRAVKEGNVDTLKALFEYIPAETQQEYLRQDDYALFDTAARRNLGIKGSGFAEFLLDMENPDRYEEMVRGSKGDYDRFSLILRANVELGQKILEGFSPEAQRQALDPKGDGSYTTAASLMRSTFSQSEAVDYVLNLDEAVLPAEKKAELYAEFAPSRISSYSGLDEIARGIERAQELGVAQEFASKLSEGFNVISTERMRDFDNKGISIYPHHYAAAVELVKGGALGQYDVDVAGILAKLPGEVKEDLAVVAEYPDNEDIKKAVDTKYLRGSERWESVTEKEAPHASLKDKTPLQFDEDIYTNVVERVGGAGNVGTGFLSSSFTGAQYAYNVARFFETQEQADRFLSSDGVSDANGVLYRDGQQYFSVRDLELPENYVPPSRVVEIVTERGAEALKFIPNLPDIEAQFYRENEERIENGEPEKSINDLTYEDLVNLEFRTILSRFDQGYQEFSGDIATIHEYIMTEGIEPSFPLATTIGIEIETFLPEKDGNATIDLADHFFAVSTGAWVPDSDMSIKGEGVSETREFVTGIVDNRNFAKVEASLYAFELMGFETNESCGLHVHLGTRDTARELAKEAAENGAFQENLRLRLAEKFDTSPDDPKIVTMADRGAEQLLRLELVKAFASEYLEREPEINTQMREDAHYAKSLLAYYSKAMPDKSKEEVIEAVKEKIENAESIEALRDVVNPDGQRYWAVNLHSMAKHGTIEVRQMDGTVNAQEIIGWVGVLNSVFESATEKVRNTVMGMDRGQEMEMAEEKTATYWQDFVETRRAVQGQEIER